MIAIPDTDLLAVIIVSFAAGFAAGLGFGFYHALNTLLSAVRKLLSSVELETQRDRKTSQ